MELEKQVVNLELARKLKELGIAQVSAFYWSGDGKLLFSEDDPVRSLKLPYVSALTVADLGEMLPAEHEYDLKIQDTNCGKRRKLLAFRRLTNGNADIACFVADTEAGARAKMLIYLLENKLTENKSSAL